MVSAINRSRAGAYVGRTKTEDYYDISDRHLDRVINQSAFHPPNIVGITKEGKFIGIQLVGRQKPFIRAEILAFLREAHKRSAHVGIAVDIHDCYDIILSRTRKNRTFGFLEEEKANEHASGTGF